MKKKLVKTLALALALSMIPVMAYGASSSRPAMPGTAQSPACGG